MNRRIVTNKFKHDIDNVNVGISVPFNGTGIFVATSTTTEQLKSNIINLLMTNKGERFFSPNYGCDLRRLLFEPMSDSLDVESLITPQVEMYIPQIEITKLDIDRSYSDYTLVINITYKIIHTSSVDVVTIAI